MLNFNSLFCYCFVCCTFLSARSDLGTKPENNSHLAGWEANGEADIEANNRTVHSASLSIHEVHWESGLNDGLKLLRRLARLVEFAYTTNYESVELKIHLEGESSDFRTRATSVVRKFSSSFSYTLKKLVNLETDLRMLEQTLLIVCEKLLSQNETTPNRKETILNLISENVDEVDGSIQATKDFERGFYDSYLYSASLSDALLGVLNTSDQTLMGTELGQKVSPIIGTIHDLFNYWMQLINAIGTFSDTDIPDSFRSFKLYVQEHLNFGGDWFLKEVEEYAIILLKSMKSLQAFAELYTTVFYQCYGDMIFQLEPLSLLVQQTVELAKETIKYPSCDDKVRLAVHEKNRKLEKQFLIRRNEIAMMFAKTEFK